MDYVYLDNAATSFTKPPGVIEAVARFMRETGASPGRSAHRLGMEAGKVVFGARRKLAELLGAPDPSRLLFTLNCTEALNVVIHGLVGKGGRVVTTSVEHNSVMRPLNELARRHGIEIERAACDAAGVTDPDDFSAKLDKRTTLAVMTAASNVTGAVQPFEDCARAAAEKNVPFLLDAAQAAGHIPLDLSSLPISAAAFSGHKGLSGPQGTGVLYLAEGFMPETLKQGGTGSASAEELQPKHLPDRYEAGTPNTPGIAGLGAAAEWLLETGIEKIREHINETGAKILKGLLSLDSVEYFGPRGMAGNAGVFSFRLKGQDPAMTARKLERRFGILTRVGLHCAPAAHRALGSFPEGTVRASIGAFTTLKDVKKFLEAVASLVEE